MSDGRKLITAVVAVLIVAEFAYADLMLVSWPDGARLQSAHVSSRKDIHRPKSSSASEFLGVPELGLTSIKFLPDMNAGVRETPETQHPHILTDGSNSLSLCLCALIGLGLCRSGHWVRKLSFGFVPEWYHSGGPFQIGHSHALMPNNLSLTPARCFIQPAFVSESLIPIYRLRTVESLWRKSQFASAVLIPRGPPHLS